MKLPHLVLVASCALLALSPLVAEASVTAAPKAGMFRTLGGGESGGFFIVSGGGKSLAPGATAQSDFKCNRMNAVVAKAVPDRERRVCLSGPLKSKPKLTITWIGKWSSATSVSGTVRIKSATCNSGLIAWKAKLAA